MDAIMRLGGSDVFATFLNRHTPRPGFFSIIFISFSNNVLYVSSLT